MSSCSIRLQPLSLEQTATRSKLEAELAEKTCIKDDRAKELSLLKVQLTAALSATAPLLSAARSPTTVEAIDVEFANLTANKLP